MNRPFFLALIVLGSAVSPARAESTDLMPYVRGAIDLYNDHHGESVLPPLTSKQATQLMDGKVVKIRRKQRGEDEEVQHRVVGYLIVDQPQKLVWLTALDPHFAGSDMLTDYRVERDGTGGSVWYQHVALPWPVTDRHWLIALDKGKGIYEASQGYIWEHSWKLAEDGEAIVRRIVANGEVEGLTSEDIEDAIYLRRNQGGWAIVKLTDTQTLIAYHVTTDVGGSIPESWIATFAMAQLGGLLQQVGEASASIAQHYRDDHEIMFAGDGSPIEPLP